jgi:predicted metal-dependent hydrolase
VTDYKLVRSARKTLAIQVYGGSVVVRAPRRLPQEDIDAFLYKKREWIDRHRREQAESQRKPFEAAEGDELLLLGRRLAIRLKPAGQPEERGGILYLPDAPDRADALRRYIKASALGYMTERVDHYARLLGLERRSVKLSDAKRRWGSCSGDDSICLSWRLALCPLELIDYVAAHEVCHIAEKNHQAAFWALLATVVPDWRERRDALKKCEPFMDAI